MSVKVRQLHKESARDESSSLYPQSPSVTCQVRAKFSASVSSATIDGPLVMESGSFSPHTFTSVSLLQGSALQ